MLQVGLQFKNKVKQNLLKMVKRSEVACLSMCKQGSEKRDGAQWGAVSKTNLNIQVCSLFGQEVQDLVLSVQCSQVKTRKTYKHTSLSLKFKKKTLQRDVSKYK